MAEIPTAVLLQKALNLALSNPKPSSSASAVLAGPSVPAAANPAIAHCLQAYNIAYQASKDDLRRLDKAGAAYRSAMPPLSGPRNIRDIVACVAHAMALNAIDGVVGARMLYAAQVASTAQLTQRRLKAKLAAITVPKPQQKSAIIEHGISRNCNRMNQIQSNQAAPPPPSPISLANCTNHP